MGKVFTQTTSKEKKIGTELNSVQKVGLLSGVSPACILPLCTLKLMSIYNLIYLLVYKLVYSELEDLVRYLHISLSNYRGFLLKLIPRVSEYCLHKLTSEYNNRIMRLFNRYLHTYYVTGQTVAREEKRL